MTLSVQKAISRNQKSTSQFIAEAQQKHGEKYDYSKVEYVSRRAHVTIICPTHGEFTQLSWKHVKGFGCPQCGKNWSPNANSLAQQFVTQSKKIHGDRYNYSAINYVNRRTPVIIICGEHGEFKQEPRRHLEGKGCQKCGVIKCKKSLSRSVDQFIELCVEKHGNRYDYSKVEYVNDTTKVIIICPKHGKFVQRPSTHLSIEKAGDCPQCADGNRQSELSWSFADFLAISQKNHIIQFDYSLVQWTKANSTITVICPEHGTFKCHARYHAHGTNSCAQCGLSQPQNILTSRLKSAGYQIEINNRDLIKPYEIDIFLPQHNVGIECNGIYYHSYNAPETTEQKRRHQIKTDVSSAAGIQLLQFTDNEIKHRSDLIISMIKSKTGQSHRIYARHCEIRWLKNADTKDFLDNNHMGGFRPARFSIGLYHHNCLVGVLTISKNAQYEWEIIRSAYVANTIVIGGFAKMLRHFMRVHNPATIMTYADRRFSSGRSYISNGFNIIAITKPNYQYCKSENTWSRQYFQKHKLRNRLKNYYPELSESLNMFANGYRRLWDAGHIKLMWSR